MKWLIYKHTNNANGKVYVGQTNQKDLNRRWKNGNGYKKYSQRKFYRAIQKYGWENFSHEILEDNIRSQKRANEREIFYINKYNSIKKGYNTALGGGAWGQGYRAVIIQIDIGSLKPIKEWSSIKEASETLGISDSVITNCLKEHLITAGGYYWCYKKDFKNWKPRKDKHFSILTRPIYCFELKQQFNNFGKLCKALNIEKNDGIIVRVLRCCRKQQSNCGGYHFCFADQKDTYIPKKEKSKFPSKLKHWTKQEDDWLIANYSKLGSEECAKFLKRSVYSVVARATKTLGIRSDFGHVQSSRKVLCVELNKVYNSINDAANDVGVTPSLISTVCKNKPKHKTAGGYHWKYINSDEG